MLLKMSMNKRSQNSHHFCTVQFDPAKCLLLFSASCRGENYHFPAHNGLAWRRLDGGGKHFPHIMSSGQIRQDARRSKKKKWTKGILQSLHMPDRTGSRSFSVGLSGYKLWENGLFPAKAMTINYSTHAKVQNCRSGHPIVKVMWWMVKLSTSRIGTLVSA